MSEERWTVPQSFNSHLILEQLSSLWNKSSHCHAYLSLHASYFCKVRPRLVDPWARVQGQARLPSFPSCWSAVGELKGWHLTCSQRILSLWIGHNAAARSAASHFSLAALPASRFSLCTTIVKVQVRAAQEEPEGDTWREKVLWSFLQQPDSRGYWSGKPAACCDCVPETHEAALLRSSLLFVFD